MDKYTDQTKSTLEERFKMTVGGIYYGHQPIYGYRNSKTSGSSIARYMVTKSILNALNKYNFKTFADIGGAEGYTANIVRKIFQSEVVSTDLSENACKIANELFQIKAIPADIIQLPFQENEFDAVLCSETIEHVTGYTEAIKELLRITKNVLVITVPHESKKIVADNIAKNIPHAHIHYFDTSTLDYLKEMGLNIRYEKTLSPLLIIPRVIAEGDKKPGNKFYYRIYNFFTPFFKKIFGMKTANWLTNMDTKMTRAFGFYQGITFVIEKNNHTKKENFSTIKAGSFTGIKVEEYQLK
jgi:ubiquinone/menaquinone biosynthesis C-methylase UbiE